MLTPEKVPIIHNHPTRPFEGLVGSEALERALDAHEELLVEVRHGFVYSTESLVDDLGQKVRSWNADEVVSYKYALRSHSMELTREGNQPSDKIDLPVLAFSSHEEVILHKTAQTVC